MSRRRIVSQSVAVDSIEVSIEDVDLLIGGATWDARCLVVNDISYRNRVTHAMLLTFEDRGTSGRVDIHEGLLREGMSRVSDNPLLTLQIDTSALVGAWAMFRRAVLNVYEAVGRPLRVAVDLNSVPRYLALSLLGFGAKTGVVASFSAIYSAARAYINESSSLSFTEGSWKPRAIPTLGEGAFPSARSVLVVSGGFEGDHTLRLVNALEPDRVIVALTTGIRVEHDRMAQRASVNLAEDYLLAEGGVVTLPAQDLASSVEKLEASLSRFSEEGEDVALSFLLSGTKIAALAMGLYAVDHGVAQVYYAEPERRLESSAVEIEWHTVVTIAL
ncbi:hypothetical protein [Microbacterium oleivorans]|uniref:hypothetical protein n=1 Tax=Microbacterium oleivorans TaxID=273677 RepID=UPI001146408C|nr:hypothetical protein [Microbacterium oleivorans]